MWQHVENLLYPELSSIAPHHRGAALRHAREEPFDLVEWGGILFGIVVATAATRYGSAGLGVVERLSMLTLNFAVAVPLLILLVGPFLVRRTRRGLTRQLNQ